MIRLIEKNLKEIRKICSQHNVKCLEVFGSAVAGKFDKTSDLDFLVEFKPLKQGQHADTYFGLLDAMKDLLGRNVDLVMTKAIKNPYFLQQINSKKETLYAA